MELSPLIEVRSTFCLASWEISSAAASEPSLPMPTSSASYPVVVVVGEDVAAERGQDRLHVVGVAELADRQVQGRLDLAGVTAAWPAAMASS